MDTVNQKIVDYLGSHRKMTLATVTPEGHPMAHTVEYASQGATIYFATRKTTRKIQNILQNPQVAYAVDEDYDDWLKIQGVQMEGVATILADQDEIDEVAAVYLEKFPFVADFPPNPELVFVKVEPRRGFFLDYTKGFTHREAAVF